MAPADVVAQLPPTFATLILSQVFFVGLQYRTWTTSQIGVVDGEHEAPKPRGAVHAAFTQLSATAQGSVGPHAAPMAPGIAHVPVVAPVATPQTSPDWQWWLLAQVPPNAAWTAHRPQVWPAVLQ
jgi:hypothetical protein